jgi:hypothetical protein
MTQTTGALTLTDFLLARIAEDETALGGEYGDWKTPSGMEDVPPQRWDYDEFHCGPNRWKAECEAKRRIVQEHEWAYRSVEEPGLRIALRALALPYAEHPDYRKEWAV